MSMGVHHPYQLDLCADDEDPSQWIIWAEWDAPHVRCFPRTFCAWPCLLRQLGTVLGSPYDYVVARLAYANPGSRHSSTSTPLHFKALLFCFKNLCDCFVDLLCFPCDVIAYSSSFVCDRFARSVTSRVDWNVRAKIFIECIRQVTL